MSKVEGITPPKKHKTFAEKRGKYNQFHELATKAQTQQRTLALIAGGALLVIIIAWVVLFKGGYLYSDSGSDATFIKSLSNELQEADTINATITTNTDQQFYNTVRDEVFPQFSN